MCGRRYQLAALLGLLFAIGASDSRAQMFSETSRTCQFQFGPKAGQQQFFPNAMPIPVGAPCTDGISSQGVAVADANPSAPSISVPQQPGMVTLNIPPILQRTPEWCWLASGAMIFQYYGFPGNAPDYQCGEARFDGAVQVGPGGPMAFNGPCWADCSKCGLASGGSIQGLINLVMQYPAFMSVVMGGSYRMQPPQVSLTPISPAQVKAEIDGGRPILIGISPGQGMQPPGVAEHAVLIVGYGNDGNVLIVNDPFPYQAANLPASYLQFGGSQLEIGRYAVSYATMIGPINWRNAVYGLQRMN